MQPNRQELKTMRNRSGFTAVELVVVIAVLGLMMAIGIPNYLSYLPNWRLRSAARDLYSNMQLAKAAAIKTNSTCTVSYSSPGTYTISGAMAETVNLADYGSGVRFQNPDSGDPNFPGSGVTFNSRGLATNFGYAYLSNQQNTGYYRVGPLISGVVRLQQYVGGNWQ